MIRSLITAAAAAGMLASLAAPALAQAPRTRTGSSDAAAPAQPSQTDSRERRICVYQEMTGSRLPRKVCQSRAEWEREGGVPSDR
jgi:hypothetical protein